MTNKQITTIIMIKIRAENTKESNQSVYRRPSNKDSSQNRTQRELNFASWIMNGFNAIFHVDQKSSQVFFLQKYIRFSETASLQPWLFLDYFKVTPIKKIINVVFMRVYPPKMTIILFIQSASQKGLKKDFYTLI